MRTTVQRLLREVPFRPFVITLENRQRLVIEHPENIAFRPDDNGRRGSREFYVLSGNAWVHSTFDAVASITENEQVEAESA